MSARNKKSFKSNDEIRFFGADKHYGQLSNYYKPKTPLDYEGKTYPTSEHLYHALKFIHENSREQELQYAEIIRKAPTPHAAKILGGQREEGAYAKVVKEYKSYGVKIRPDWETVKVSTMELVLKIKFYTDDECRDVLMGTGEKSLIEDSPYDSFWGCGANGTGKNMLGKVSVCIRV